MSEYIVRMPSDMPYEIKAELNAWYVNSEPIVRCRDCEHARIMRPLDWKTGKPSTVIEEWYCNWHSNAEGASEIEPDGFCAWAEPKVGVRE